MELKPIRTKVKPQIVVIGIGGAGRNAVNNIIEAGLEEVKFIVVDTSKPGMEGSKAFTAIQIGENLTHGFGTGSLPEVGKAAAEESIEKLKANIPECHMVFLTAGFGGGTGTGATPVIAQICKTRSDLIVGVVSKPFAFEGKKKLNVAETGITILRENIDTLITIPNDRMRTISSKGSRLVDIFRKADEVLQNSVKTIIDLININGYVNLDFADIKSILKNAGNAIIGFGKADGPDRAVLAVGQALSHPFLENIELSGARKALYNIAGGQSVTFEETTTISDRIRDAVGDDADVFWGQTIDDSFGEQIQVTLIVTGISGARDDSLKPMKQ